MAPFAPFMAEWLWQRVHRDDDPESVHLVNWCSVKEADTQILEEMKKVRDIVSLGLKILYNFHPMLMFSESFINQSITLYFFR